MNETTLLTFPSTKAEALALLYVQAQDLSNVTPEELTAMYKDTYDRIIAENKRLRGMKK